MSVLPDSMHAGMTKANGTEEVVEEMCERTPAEVRVSCWVVFSFENPVRWYLGDASRVR